MILRAFLPMVLAAFLAGCTSEPVDFAVEPTVRDGAVELVGSTSLVDTSRVSCEVWHESEDEGLGPGDFMDLAWSEVQDGRFNCEVDVSGWPAGTIRASVTFEPYEPDQPAVVVETYGTSGQRLAGPLVTHSSDGAMLQILLDLPTTNP